MTNENNDEEKIESDQKENMVSINENKDLNNSNFIEDINLDFLNEDLDFLNDPKLIEKSNEIEKEAKIQESDPFGNILSTADSDKILSQKFYNYKSKGNIGSKGEKVNQTIAKDVKIDNNQKKLSFVGKGEKLDASLKNQTITDDNKIEKPTSEIKQSGNL